MFEVTPCGCNRCNGYPDDGPEPFFPLFESETLDDLSFMWEFQDVPFTPAEEEMLLFDFPDSRV